MPRSRRSTEPPRGRKITSTRASPSSGAGSSSSTLPFRKMPSTDFSIADLPHHAPRQEAFQLARPHGVLELADGLGLHLPHALARHLEDAADFLQRVGVAVADAVAQLDDLA